MQLSFNCVEFSGLFFGDQGNDKYVFYIPHSLLDLSLNIIYIIYIHIYKDRIPRTCVFSILGTVSLSEDPNSSQTHESSKGSRYLSGWCEPPHLVAYLLGARTI